MELGEIIASLDTRPHLWWLDRDGWRLRHANGLALWVGDGWWGLAPIYGSPVPCCHFGLIARWRIWRAFRRWQRWEAVHRLGRAKEGDRV